MESAEAVAATEESAKRVATGAPASTTHVSIFNEVSTESLSDFALDYAAEARQTYGSWDGFKSRVLKGYIAGVGEGAWGVVKDLFNLVVELGDLTGENLESAVEGMTGAELDIFGDENLQAARKIIESADKLISNEDGAGLEEARKLVAAAEAIQRVIKRKAETLAGSGERGIQEGLNLTGQATANVLIDPLQAAGAAAKVTGQGGERSLVPARRRTLPRRREQPAWRVMSVPPVESPTRLATPQLPASVPVPLPERPPAP